MKELSNIKGLGPKTIEVINKLNIYDVSDLVYYFPYRYEVIRRSDVSSLNQDDNIIIDGIVENIPNFFRINKRLDRMQFNFNTGCNIFRVVIFNRGYLRPKLKIGTKVSVFGKYDMKNGIIVANNIKLEGLPDHTVITPIYNLVEGISNTKLNQLILNATKSFIFESRIPSYLEEKNSFIDSKLAVSNIHRPESPELFKEALKRFKYEELFEFLFKVNYVKEIRNNKKGIIKIYNEELLDSFLMSLPFSLTTGQINVINDIKKDLSSNKIMNRLIQGDVGSGKTIVSFAALYINYLSGFQGVLMAPTEVLARQHLENFNSLFKMIGVKALYLGGSLKSKERREALKLIETGKVDIIIGTHALFSDDVVYNKLGLVVADEQHRFGVNQRGKLINKGESVDVLYLTATPIPRTYTLVLYGDMDVSIIDTLPSDRLEIVTSVVSKKSIKLVLDSMYNELLKGRQVYVVAPQIDEGEEERDVNNVNELFDNMTKAFGSKYKIGLLHGKMKDEEKENVMNSFKNGVYSILISTTVIEVGVDVKNASMMVIMDANYFGLSTLHQLRGRVGRSSHQSYCILVSDVKSKRLSILVKTTDGFLIAEEDFKLRGSGEIFGLKQSGDANFKFIDLNRDVNLIGKVNDDLSSVLSRKQETERLKIIYKIDAHIS